MLELISCEPNIVVKQNFLKCWFNITRHITYLTVGKNSFMYIFGVY